MRGGSNGQLCLNCLSQPRGPPQSEPTARLSSAWSASRVIFGHVSHEYEPEFDFRKDQNEEEDRMNEEDDEDEERSRQKKQDDQEDEDIYSDDMHASSV
jgi:hypothetical protein